jgi:uncharacterized membrane protein
MIEIIPNWHPTWVHFTVGLLLTSAALFLVAAVWKLPTATTVARWNLWIGTAFAVVTVTTGYLAYHDVAHDADGHAAMKLHQWWARVTLILFLVAAVLAWRERFRETGAGPVLLAAILIASGTLGVTAWLGAENVYRHGIGVMRLPEAHAPGGGHHHDHSHGHMHGHGGGFPSPEAAPDDAHGHEEPGDAKAGNGHDHAH